MKRIICIALSTLLCLAASAQQKGAITPEMLQQIKASYGNSPQDKAIRNALNGTTMKVLATNAENAAMMDTHFSDKVVTRGITDQKKSGRCWLFTGLNFLRADAIARYDLGDFQFSQNYCFFYDQLEKANLFLQAVIDTRDKAFEDREVDWLFSNPISDGGTFTGVANLVTKYGAVPAEAMPESFIANSTSEMSAQLKTILRQDGLKLRSMKKGFEEEKTRMLGEIYHVLAICLGVPPESFEWTRYNSKGEFVSCRTYTPQEFAREFIDKDLENGYVMLMNDPTREYGKVYEIQYDRHLYEGQNWLYVNLPIERIKEMAIASIKANTAMYFSCDVGKFADSTKGTLDLANYDYESLLGVSFTMDKKQRVMTHASGSSHAMTLMAVDIKDGKPVKWMVENSWGKTSGYKGHFIMTDEWFNEYMFRLVVEKRFVPADIIKMMEQKPIALPAWDPMFAVEE